MASLISVIGTILYLALLLYFFVLWARFILDLARVLRPQWRPSGVGLVLAELSFTVTDPPIRFFRRVLPQGGDRSRRPGFRVDPDDALLHHRHDARECVATIERPSPGGSLHSRQHVSPSGSDFASVGALYRFSIRQ
ncbi:MAG TPA: YggT family protein [Plantibacter sp.]|uniref:YggT family protein n=1 Tax=Plantibacter sp. TaxID=1871045 RepID=UPI002BD33114|nr:YggT family protein [Plantibacter sp.]